MSKNKLELAVEGRERAVQILSLIPRAVGSLKWIVVHFPCFNFRYEMKLIFSNIKLMFLKVFFLISSIEV